MVDFQFTTGPTDLFVFEAPSNLSFLTSLLTSLVSRVPSQTWTYHCPSWYDRNGRLHNYLRENQV